MTMTMKIFAVLILAGLTGCFSANGGNVPSNGEPEIFSAADPSSVSPPTGLSQTAANSYSPPVSEEKEPQNLIKVYSAPQGVHCPPCQRFNTWHSGLTAKQREELSVEFIAVDPQSHPAWLASYPTFHWKVGDQWWKSEGWEGIDKFAITYNQTLKLSKKKGNTTPLPAPLPESKSSASSSVQEPPSSDGPAGEQSSRSDTEYGSSFRQKRRWR